MKFPLRRSPKPEPKPEHMGNPRVINTTNAPLPEVDSDEDRKMVRVVIPQEEVGNMQYGPVVVMHQSTSGSLISMTNPAAARVFGPFDTIADALYDIKVRSAQSGDRCFKVILSFIFLEEATGTAPEHGEPPTYVN